MTSTQSMIVARGIACLVAPLLMVLCALSAAGCGSLSTPKLTPPTVLESPYGSQDGDVLWAVAPLRNESGTTQADPLVMSDKVIAAIAETKGLRCLPLNRTIEAMRALNMASVRSPADALTLARTLGADGIIVGSITAYEPYQPTLGLTLALYGRAGAMNTPQAASLDARALASKTTEPQREGPGNFGTRPLSVAAEHLDGKNHQVLLDVESYATGRSDPKSSLGWKRYVASMDLYMEFAANHVVGRLLREEARRLGPVPQEQTKK